MSFADQRGFPAADIYLTLVSQDRVRQAKTDNSGKVEFTALPFQTYELEVWSASFASITLPNIQITTKDPKILDIHLKLWTPSEQSENTCPPPLVVGSVRYEERTAEAQVTGVVAEILRDQPLKGATITLVKSETPDNVTAQANTDANGIYEFKDVEPGRYTLTVSHKGNVEKPDNFHFWVARENLTRVGRILFGLSRMNDICGSGLEILVPDTRKPIPDLIPPR